MPKSVVLKDSDGNEIASGYDFNSAVREGFVFIIEEEVIAPSQLLIDKGYKTSAVKLLLSGIELMAYLWAEEDAKSGPRFKDWCNKFLQLGSEEEIEKYGTVTACELWQSRNDYLHAHGYRLYEECKTKDIPTCSCRRIVFHRDKVPYRYLMLSLLPQDKLKDKLIYFPVDHLLKRFMAGVEDCSSCLYSDKNRERTKNRLMEIAWSTSGYLLPAMIDNEVVANFYRERGSKSFSYSIGECDRTTCNKPIARVTQSYPRDFKPQLGPCCEECGETLYEGEWPPIENS